ncbi:MAG: LysR family transcriptional regulator [Pseudomonadota bacterium]|uniref:LysR family transcriptional regulator n=1 Tax=Rhizorhabdus phycosphaerae TaxID=2711156 RepID=UPI0013EBEB42|nr:LysR family transcriptional regulator [Rhizorhabdus phycosphaerae]
MTPIDIRQVRMFVAVADSLSFTRAAETLHVAQPWLSVQIRKLEEQIGFQLFLRNRNRGVLLTDQGHAFLKPARSYVEAANMVAEAAHEMRANQALSLKLGAPDFSAEIPAREALLDRFLRRHPRIEMEIVNAWSSQLLDGLLRHEIDLAFTVGPFERDGCEVLDLAHFRWALLLDKERAAAWGPEISLDSLRGQQIASFRRNINPIFYDSIAARLSRHGIEILPLPESSLAGIRQHAMRSHVPVLMSEWHAASNHGPDLTVLPLADTDFTVALHLVRRENDDRSAVRALWQLAREVATNGVDIKIVSNTV